MKRLQQVSVEHVQSTLLVRATTPEELVTGQLFADLAEIVRRLRRDRTTRAVIITGPRPGVFLPHFDLAEIKAGAEELGMATPLPVARLGLAVTAGLTRSSALSDALTKTPLGGLVTLLETHRALAAFATLPQVVIAAIDGDAMGGGCEVALACDLRLMSEGPYLLGLPELTAGIPQGAGGSVRLTRLVGASRAAELILQAKALDPSAAAAAGLVQTMPSADLMPNALDIADRVAQLDPVAVASSKRAIAAAHQPNALMVEAAGFVATVSRAESIARLGEFVAASAGRQTPWRDRSWLGPQTSRRTEIA